MKYYSMSPCTIFDDVSQVVTGGGERGKGVSLVRWEVATQPLDLGGLGIGNLRACKEALLAKWLWWFP